MLHARRTTLALLFFLVNSPEQISKPNSYALHIYVPPLPKCGGGGQHIVFGTDPVGVGISVKLLVHSVTCIPFGIF